MLLFMHRNTDVVVGIPDVQPKTESTENHEAFVELEIRKLRDDRKLIQAQNSPKTLGPNFRPLSLELDEMLEIKAVLPHQSNR